MTTTEQTKTAKRIQDILAQIGDTSDLSEQVVKDEIETPETAKTVEEIAADIAADLGGRVWEGYGKVRVYVYKNWIGISPEGIDLSGLGRNNNEEMKAAAHKAAGENGLEVYEIYRGRKISA